jgi:hypothetical protein
MGQRILERAEGIPHPDQLAMTLIWGSSKSGR